MSPSLCAKHERVLIIGAGVFGLSLGLELSKRGYTNVTIMDRFLPPVPDGSSVDISRVIRPDYADGFYATMGMEALSGWQNEYRDYFFQSGLLCLSQDQSHPYIESSRLNLEKLGMPVQLCQGDQIRERFPAISGQVSSLSGYWNSSCGWANAEGAIRHLAALCTQAGVSFVCGTQGTVVSLLESEKRIIGVRTRAGISFFAETVVVATGAWTPFLVSMDKTSISTSQPVAFLQLTDEEASRMRDCPVIIDISTGWFCFPPTPGTNVLKMARHGYGYETSRQSQVNDRRETTSIISAPAQDKNNATSMFIPEEADKALRNGLVLLFPGLRDRTFFRRRLCWYTDTATGDFVVDYHPRYDNLFLASGGSGQYTADSFELKASAVQQSKWSWRESDTPISKGDGSRGGPARRVLSEQEQARL